MCHLICRSYATQLCLIRLSHLCTLGACLACAGRASDDANGPGKHRYRHADGLGSGAASEEILKRERERERDFRGIEET